MTTLTVGDMLDLLAHHDPRTPVLIAHQPSWPLAEVLAGVVDRECRVDDRECEEHDGFLVGHAGCSWTPNDEDDADGDAVWLVAGGHPYDRSPYAPRWVFDSAGVPR